METLSRLSISSSPPGRPSVSRSSEIRASMLGNFLNRLSRTRQRAVQVRFDAFAGLREAWNGRSVALPCCSGALLASGQINMRKSMVGRRSPQSPLISRLTLQLETISSCYGRSRHSEFQPHSRRHLSRFDGLANVKSNTNEPRVRRADASSRSAGSHAVFDRL